MHVFLPDNSALCQQFQHLRAYGTTTTPMLAACEMTLFTIPSNDTPDSLLSLDLIFAISHTCFKLTDPTVPRLLLPAAPAPVV